METNPRELPLPPAWPPPREKSQVWAALRYARLNDPLGHRLHLAFAVFQMAMLPFSTALNSIAFALLVGFTMLRLPRIWRRYPALLRNWLLGSLLACTIWHGLSCLWSEVPIQGLDELKAARVILLPLALWPVLEHLSWLLIAALLGVVAQNGSQLLQVLGIIGDPAELKGRYRGLLDGQTAMWCLAAMGWHLSGTLRGIGRVRWLSLAGLLIASAGLIVSGNRGPWIATAFVMPLTLLIIALRRPETRRFALLLFVAALLGSLALWPLASGFVKPRITKAIDEVIAAREDGVYWTSGGLRVGLWKWAADGWRESPIIGLGAGGYHEFVLNHPDYQRAFFAQQELAPHSEKIDRDHAHNTYLHTLTTQGVIGIVLLALMLILLIRQILFDPPDHLHADGTIFILLGWLIAANFDCYTLNGHLYGLLMVIVAITLPHRLARTQDST